MRNISLVDETFDINISHSYKLAIQFTRGGLSFAILDTVRRKYVVFKNLLFDDSLPLSEEDQVKRFLERDIYLSKSYKSSGFIFATSNASLVPNDLWTPDSEKDFFTFSNLLPETHLLLSNNIQGIDAKMVFSFPRNLYDALEDHQNEFKIIHQSCPLIENALRSGGHSGKLSRVFINIYPDFMDAAALINGKFELYNSFQWKSKEDLIFYILYVYEQFGLKALQADLVISGYIEKDSETITKLKQFLPNVIFDSFNKNFTYSYTFSQLSQHQYSNLINIHSCV